jgi:hypothetical protein
MNFKQFINELASIESGQAIIAHEPSEQSSSSIMNRRVQVEINHLFMQEFSELILSPENGIQKVRKVLHRYGLDMPALYDADSEGDEIIIAIEQYGNPEASPGIYLYLIYYLTDNGNYDFYAEITNDEGINAIISDDDEDDEN